MRALLPLAAGIGGLFIIGYAFAGLFWVLERALRWQETRRQQRAGSAARQRARAEAADDAADRIIARADIDTEYQKLCERENGRG